MLRSHCVSPHVLSSSECERLIGCHSPEVRKLGLRAQRPPSEFQPVRVPLKSAIYMSVLWDAQHSHLEDAAVIPLIATILDGVLFELGADANNWNFACSDAARKAVLDVVYRAGTDSSRLKSLLGCHASIEPAVTVGGYPPLTVETKALAARVARAIDAVPFTYDESKAPSVV